MARITTEFGEHSTAAEVVEGIDLSGKRAIVTGGASGIGVETVRALAGAGADVTIAARNLEAANETAADVERTTGKGVKVGRLELMDRASIAAFTGGWDGPLDILVNNAGVMAIQELELTPDGWEKQFGTNHMGHFELTTRLHAALAAAGNARVVSVSSSGHKQSPVVFEDINFESRPYDPWKAYGQSKTANVLFAVEITNRWAGDGITSNALMPGGIDTALQRHVDPDWMEKARADAGGAGAMKSTEEGAATSVLLATSPELEGIGGLYFEDCNQAVPASEDTDARHGIEAYALDPEAARRLWELSEESLA